MSKAMIGLMGLLLVCLPAWAQDTEVTQATRAKAPVEAGKPPPPAVAGLVLLPRSYAPDLEKIRRLRAELDSPVKDTTDAVDLAREWHTKALVAEQLAENDRRYAALEQALVYARRANSSGAANEIGSVLRIRQDLAFATHVSRGWCAWA